MALKTDDPSSLWEEIQAAEEQRDHHTNSVKNMVEMYTSGAYRDDEGNVWPENHFYEWFRLTTAQIVYDNPKTRVRSRREAPASMIQRVEEQAQQLMEGLQTGQVGPEGLMQMQQLEQQHQALIFHRNIAYAMEHGLNRWVRECNLRKVLKRLYVDSSFAFGVGMTASERRTDLDPRQTGAYYLPKPYQLPMDYFGFDPYALHFGAARYAFHKWVRDKDDLIEEAESQPDKDEPGAWDIDVLRNLTPGAGIESLGREKTGYAPTRGEVVGYDLWIPEAFKDVDGHPGPDEGFHGSIYTLMYGQGESSEGAAAFIRSPRPYYGPKTGPYSLFGVYTVPNRAYPMGPLAATYHQTVDLNQVAKAINKATSEYKRIILFDAANPELGKKLKKTPDAFIVPVKGFKKDEVVQMELGGVTPQHPEQLALMRDRLDRNSGIHEAQRGNVQGAATATEIAVADESSSQSLAYVKQEFADCTQQMLSTAAWLMFHDDRTRFPLGAEASEFFGMPQAEFRGGIYGDERFEDLELEIEPYSMERVNEALMQRRGIEMTELAIKAGPVMPLTPQIDWKFLFQNMGDRMNDSQFGRVIKADVAEQMQGQMMQMQQQEAMSQAGGGSTPSVSAGPPQQQNKFGGRGPQLAAEARGARRA